MKVCSVCQRCYEDDVLSCAEENHEILTEARAVSCEVVPNYRLEFLHESFSAGETFRAVNTILKKPYLVKILAPELFDEDSKRQFLRETQVLSAVIHPNVARVFESGTLADGSLYAVTEFFTAQTLRECLENVGAPSEVTALTITRQAAEGLEAIHAAGIRHRNIRPENIILTADAENRFLVKLQDIDFGAIHQKQVNSYAELYLSDLRYFSPEQCAAQDADAQSDVYSLGIVLYETLAGNVPFDSPYADALITKQINETPPEVKIKTFDIRMLLTHTLTDALQKQARTRLKSANAFTRQLRHIEQLATHSSTPPPAISYPATMVKAAVAFTPPAKIEKTVAVKSKLPVEELSLVETEAAFPEETPVFVKKPTVTKKSAKVQARPVAEFAHAVENEPVVEEIPPVIEDQIFVEDFSLAENQEAIEEMSPALEEEIAAGELTLAENQAVIEEITSEAETHATIEGKLPLAETRIAAEELNLAENDPVIEEKTLSIETAFEENQPVVEAQTVFENPVAIESEPVVEEIPPALEMQPVVEKPSVTKTVFEAPLEVSTTFENAPEAQRVAEEEPVAVENQIVFEAPVETQTAIENPVEIEPPAAVEDLIAVEMQTVVEDVNPAAVEMQPVVEEVTPAVVEIQTAVEYPVQTEARTAIENPVEFESQAVIENPVEAETQTAAAEPESPEPVFIDYTTTKLPPLETVVVNPPLENIKITEITPIFRLRPRVADIHETSEPVVIKWEQPDDIPTVTQALNEKIKDNADAEFTSPSNFVDDDEDYIIDAGEIDSPPSTVSKDYEYRRDYAAERPVFSYDDSGTSWNLPDSRKMLTGAGILALIVLAIGGTWLSRQFQIASADNKTTAQSSPNVKSVPKSAEPNMVLENDKPSTKKPENLTVSNPSSNDDTAVVPEIPAYQPRETEAKTRVKKRAPRENAEKTGNTAETKNESNVTFDKQGNKKSTPDKQSDAKNQTTKPKMEIFSRPRIVRNPKN